MHNDQSHYFLKQLHSYKVGLVCDFIAHKPAQSDCLLMKSHDPYTGERGGGGTLHAYGSGSEKFGDLSDTSDCIENATIAQF